MRSPRVVELDPPADAGAGVGSRGVLRQVDLLIFERAPQPLDEDVIHPAALAVHRDLDPGVLEPVGEGQACELAPLVGVEDLGGPVACERLGQGVDTEVRLERVRQPPGQDLPARPIHDRDQIEKAARQRDVRHVRAHT